MPFTAVCFDTDAGDAWSDALLDAGALSVEATDPFVGTPEEQLQFAEPGSPADAGWRVARLTALFDPAADANRALRTCAGMLGISPPDARSWVIEDRDWVRETQSQFGPIAIGDRLHIVPTWCEAPSAGVVVRLDPGLAFGTGSHPTTRLCLAWLADVVRGGETVLDYGCGSGILAIAAAKLGAATVVGIDIDLHAVRASCDNARANAVDATFDMADALPATSFDIVVSNILANPLRLMAPLLASRARIGGRIALSGILDSQVDAVVIAYSRWFKLAACRRADGWVLLSGERSASP